MANLLSAIVLWLGGSAALLVMTLIHPMLEDEPAFSPYYLINGSAGVFLVVLTLGNLWALLKLPPEARFQRVSLHSLSGATLAICLAVAMMAAPSHW